MALSLAELPTEVLERILSILDAVDLASCAQTNHFFFDVIQNSLLLQYHIILHNTRTEDNPICQLPTVDRIAMLKAREDAWLSLEPAFIRTIQCGFSSGSLYDLSNGVFVLGDATRSTLHYLYLPNTKDEPYEWHQLHRDDQAFIVDFGLSVYEHDLIAIITSTPVQEHMMFDLDLHLHCLSSGKKHPMAKHPKIHIHRARARPSIYLEIVGDHVVLVVTYSSQQDGPLDLCCVYDWKEGDMRLKMETDYDSYFSCVFLTEWSFLLPNATNGTLDLWRIPQRGSPAPSAPELRLSLPQLSPGWQFAYIMCRCDPNPIGDGSRTHSRDPFHVSAASAIVLCELHLVYANNSVLLSMFIRRDSLVHILNDKDLASRFEDCDVIPWEDWGPPVSRFFASPRIFRWITTTSGMRFAMLPRHQGEPHRAHRHFIIYDFNPYNANRVPDDKNIAESERWRMVSKNETLIQPYFREPVVSTLPVAAYLCRKECKFTGGVMSDERRVIGLKIGSASRIESLEILYFG